MVHKAIPIAVGVVGLVLVLLASILGWVVLPKVIDKKIKEETRLIPGSETWDKWADITLPIQMKFYIFHVTNTEDVLQGSFPIFEEKGPYVYKEKRSKANLTVDGDDISYNEVIEYYFSREESSGSDEDTWDVINPALISVIDGIDDIMEDEDGPQLPLPGFTVPALLRYVGWYFNLPNVQEKAIRNIKVRELLFDGFDVQKYLDNDILKLVLSEKEEFKHGRFGLYYKQNGTENGTREGDSYSIKSGVEDHKVFGSILEWNNKTAVLDFWNPPGMSETSCDKIVGTDGSLFPPFVEKILQVFVSDLCRSLYLTYKEEVEFMGIKGYRFVVPREMLEDPRINPENRCFCMNEHLEDCPGGGAIDVGVCRSGAPIVMSAPHFLDGDVRYYQNLNIVPEREKHLTTMDLEPNSGVLLQAVKRLQVNIHTKNFGKYNVAGFTHLREILAFPLVWVEETAGLDEESAEDLKGKLIKPLKIINVSKWTVLGVGIFFTVAGILWLVLNK